MEVLKKVIIILTMLTATVNAETNNVKRILPWIGLSSIWGQGNSGVALKESEDLTYFLRYNFVWQWDEAEFSYHQVAPSIDYEDLSLGTRYRWQNDQGEISPFVGYFNQWHTKYPTTLYNEIEYRFNPVISNDDYMRTRTMLTFYATKAFYRKHNLRPYIMADIFTNWREPEIEKTRLIVGYIMRVGRLKGTIYVIPLRDGAKEEEWKDQSRFGASAIISF